MGRGKVKRCGKDKIRGGGRGKIKVRRGWGSGRGKCRARVGIRVRGIRIRVRVRVRVYLGIRRWLDIHIIVRDKHLPGNGSGNAAPEGDESGTAELIKAAPGHHFHELFAFYEAPLDPFGGVAGLVRGRGRVRIRVRVRG